MTLRSLTANTETSIVKQLTLMLSSATTYLHPLAVVTQRASLKKKQQKKQQQQLTFEVTWKKTYTLPKGAFSMSLFYLPSIETS